MYEGYEHWQVLKKPLYQLCVNEYGEDLLQALAALPANSELESVKNAVRVWLENFIFPNLNTLRGGENTQFLAFFSQEQKTAGLSRRLKDGLSKIHHYWSWQETKPRDKAKGILGQCFKQYLYEVRTDGSRTNQRLEKVEQAIRTLRTEAEQNLDDLQRHQQLNALADPEHLAMQLFEYFNGTYSELLLLETIYELEPTEALALGSSKQEPVEHADFALHFMPDMYKSLIDWEAFEYCLECEQCPYPLTAEERQAVNIKLEKEVNGGSDAELCKHYGLARETLRTRFKSAQTKLLNCFTS